MKKLGISILLVFCSVVGFSQLELGPRVGLGTAFTDVDATSDNIKSGDAEFGFSVGLFTRFGGDKVKIMPELLYSTVNTNVVFNEGDIDEQVFDSKLGKIDVPINLQLVLADFLNLSGGVVGSYIIEEEAGLGDNTEEAFQNYKDFTFGYQAGIGLDIGNFLIDLKYEDSLSDLSETNRFAGVNFDERQSMVKALLGIKLF